MHTIKGVYENGQIILPEGEYPPGRHNVIVLFPDDQVSVGIDLTAGEKFVQKWEGIIEGCNIEGWKDQKADDIQRKAR